MRTTEERLVLINKRKKIILEHKKKILQRTVCIVSSAACLITAVFIGIYVSSLGVSYADSYTASGTASFIGGSESAGYAVVGVLCFMLGVCLTLLLYKIHDKNKKDE